MIKEVLRFETTDGSVFSKRKDAEKYEELYERCEKIMSPLRPHEDYGAVRQDIDTVKKAFAEFMGLCGDVIPNWKELFDKTATGEAHPSHAARVISDYGFDCLSSANFRFMCTNMNSGIEYEQPYFVSHEDEWRKKIL